MIEQVEVAAEKLLYGRIIIDDAKIKN